MILYQSPLPIVLAPLAGGPATPNLTAAVSQADGFGFLAAGYLTADALRDRLAVTPPAHGPALRGQANSRTNWPMKPAMQRPRLPATSPDRGPRRRPPGR